MLPGKQSCKTEADGGVVRVLVEDIKGNRFFLCKQAPASSNRMQADHICLLIWPLLCIETAVFELTSMMCLFECPGYVYMGHIWRNCVTGGQTV